jgi:hypothetical protein
VNQANSPCCADRTFVAIAVVGHARDRGQGRDYPDSGIEAAVDRAMWWPDYVAFEPDPGLQPTPCARSFGPARKAIATDLSPPRQGRPKVGAWLSAHD